MEEKSKKSIKTLDEIAKNAKLEFIDDGPDEPRSGTPENPETLLPDESSLKKSNIYQFKQNFGLSLMGIIMIGLNLNRLSRELNHPVYYHTTVITFLAFSLFVNLSIVICALIMSTFDVNKSQNLIKSTRFNNILLYCLFLAFIFQVGLISFDFISPKTNEKVVVASLGI